MDDYWILKGKLPVRVNFLEWAMWSVTAKRRVKSNKIGHIMVSTVFLGIDHNFSEEGPPILFETLVFGGPLDNKMDRYCTWEEAEKGHEEMLKKVMVFLTPQN